MKTCKAVAFLLLLAGCAFLVTSSLQTLASRRRELAAASAAVAPPAQLRRPVPASDVQTANENPPFGSNLDDGPAFDQGGGPPDFGGPGGPRPADSGLSPGPGAGDYGGPVAGPDVNATPAAD